MFYKYFKFIIVLCFCFSLGAIDCSAKTNEIIVGFYEDNPYYFLNEKGEPQGYYHDLMEIISDKLDLEYKYEYLTIEDCLKKLEREEIDLLFGVAKTETREEIFEYSKYRINNLENSIYTNKKIKFGDLSALNGLVLGFVSDSYNYNRLIDILKREEINYVLKYSDSYSELKQWLGSGEIDYMVSNSYDESLNSFQKVYNYPSGPAYIVTHNNNQQIMKRIDTIFDEMAFIKVNKFFKCYNKYFNPAYQFLKEILNILLIGGILVSLIFLVRKMILTSQRQKKYNNYLYYLKTDCFKLFYQPIVNPKDESFIGFESLLRLNQGEKTLTPNIFLKDIEELDMMYDLTLWIINKALADYSLFKYSQRTNPSDYYVSINLSYKELLNPNFLEDIKKILSKHQTTCYNLCFEIVENFLIDDIALIQKKMNELKELGIKFAMDDFGVKYANFDILEKIDFDVVKLDKIFIEECSGSIEKREMLKCILTIIKLKQKKVVIEGVEVIEEVKIIKELSESEVYIQGYYYSRPLPIQELIKY